MKRIVLTLVFAGFILGCSKSPEQKAKDLIQSYIKKNANDPESYEPVDFGSLDTINSIGPISAEYLILKEQYDMILDDDFDKKIEILDRQKNILNDTLKYPKGLAINHTYRAKNGFGAKILGHTRFYFNLELDSIIYQEDFK